MSPEGFTLSEAPSDNANKSQTSPSSDVPPAVNPDTKKTENGDGEGNKPTGNKVSRKRTKTGCLSALLSLFFCPPLPSSLFLEL